MLQGYKNVFQIENINSWNFTNLNLYKIISNSNIENFIISNWKEKPFNYLNKEIKF